jgi:hypothetical protein
MRLDVNLIPSIFYSIRMKIVARENFAYKAKGTQSKKDASDEYLL